MELAESLDNVDLLLLDHVSAFDHDNRNNDDRNQSKDKGCSEHYVPFYLVSLLKKGYQKTHSIHNKHYAVLTMGIRYVCLNSSARMLYSSSI